MTMHMRIAVLAFFLLANAALAVQESGAGDSRVKQLQRDQALIESLVEGALNLAAEDDPLRRADYCNRLADGLRLEMKKAWQLNDTSHAIELGEQMPLLVQGVAANLNLAMASMTPNSPRTNEVARLGQEVAGVTKALEDEVRADSALDQDLMLPTLRAVADAKTAVDLAVKGKGKAKGKK
jgi:hypothetical protein